MGNGFKMLQFNGVCKVPNNINVAQYIYPPRPFGLHLSPPISASDPDQVPEPPPPVHTPMRAPLSGPVRPPPPVAPTVWPRPAPSVWPQQPRCWAPSAPSVRPRLLLSTNNYKFFHVFVSQCLSCVRSLKSVASLNVVPLHETHFTRAFGQGSQS
jgi:hypothetical protein